MQDKIKQNLKGESKTRNIKQKEKKNNNNTNNNHSRIR